MDTAPRLLDAGAEALGVPLSPEQVARLLAYLDAMLEVNRHLNLTSIRDRDEAVVRHLLDSLSVVPVWHAVAGAAPPRRLLDLGTGGGFPGVPLAVVWPETDALLVDGTGKKARAVAACLESTGIGNAEALQARGEQLHAIRKDTAGAIDLCVARAVSRADGVVRNTRRLIAPGGCIFVMKGPTVDDEERVKAEKAARGAGLAPEPPQHTNVPGLERRTVLVYAKRG